MTSLQLLLPLLATEDVSRAVRSHFDRSASLSWFLLFLGVAGALAGTWAVLDFLQNRARHPSSRSAFEELVHVHGLERRELKLLRQVAAAVGFSDPAFVFVRPDAFELAAASGELDAQRLERLRQKLFGS